ncbi:hypothetical protein [Actinomyces ruminis]|uniref:PH domain-containing protein n=1 Tax=Actinomyces ruminis TaxID=1937003 RepID=A0ABX4MB67_9ACTO|nr:hypothetical protein [Actinomyces ruminis]PHP52720.1 hypothetical protein BW737_007625 [Actinomyces ruminis]
MPALADRHPYGPHGDAPEAGVSAQVPESLVRKPGVSTCVGGALIASVGIFIAVVGIRMAPDPDMEIRYVWLAFWLGVALMLLCAGLTLAVRRTVFDASGIHSRGLIRRVDLPWPDTRAAFVVDVHESSRDRGRGRRSRRREVTLTVQVMTPERTVTLAMPRILSADVDRETVLRARLEADLDEIWGWALTRGYAHERVPGGHAPGRSGQDPQRVSYGGLPADQTLLAQEPLVLKWRPDARSAAFIGASIGFMLAGGLGIVHALRAADDLASASVESVVVAVSCAVVGVALLFLIGECANLRSRLTISRDGLAWTGLWHARQLAWPRSRSCIFVHSRRRSGRTTATVRVLAPDGRTLAVPGLTWRSKHDRQALLPAATAAHSIWQWGASRGAARDNGEYYIAADADTERSRVDAARRIDYLLAHSQEPR